MSECHAFFPKMIFTDSEGFSFSISFLTMDDTFLFLPIQLSPIVGSDLNIYLKEKDESFKHVYFVPNLNFTGSEELLKELEKGKNKLISLKGVFKLLVTFGGKRSIDFSSWLLDMFDIIKKQNITEEQLKEALKREKRDFAYVQGELDKERIENQSLVMYIKQLNGAHEQEKEKINSELLEANREKTLLEYDKIKNQTRINRLAVSRSGLSKSNKRMREKLAIESSKEVPTEYYSVDRIKRMFKLAKTGRGEFSGPKLSKISLDLSCLVVKTKNSYGKQFVAYHKKVWEKMGFKF